MKIIVNVINAMNQTVKNVINPQKYVYIVLEMKMCPDKKFLEYIQRGTSGQMNNRCHIGTQRLKSKNLL